jgi:hypothetical protein
MFIDWNTVTQHRRLISTQYRQGEKGNRNCQTYSLNARSKTIRGRTYSRDNWGEKCSPD